MGCNAGCRETPDRLSFSCSLCNRPETGTDQHFNHSCVMMHGARDISLSLHAHGEQRCMGTELPAQQHEGAQAGEVLPLRTWLWQILQYLVFLFVCLFDGFLFLFFFSCPQMGFISIILGISTLNTVTQDLCLMCLRWQQLLLWNVCPTWKWSLGSPQCSCNYSECTEMKIVALW